MRELAEHAAEAVEQVRLQLELVERVGEVAGDRKGAPLGEDMDLRRAGEDLRGGGEARGVDVLLELLQLADRLADEARQHAGVAVLAAAAHLADALAVRRRALDQVALEHLLHLREAVEAERVGEPDHRRRLDLVGLRHRSDRAEGEVVGLLEREARQALQLRRQARVRRGDRFLELFVGGGGSGHRRGGKT